MASLNGRLRANRRQSQAWPNIKAQPTEATHTRGGDPERTVADICSRGDCDRGNTDRVLRHKTPHSVCRVATGRRGIPGVDRRPAAASLLAQKSERRHGRYTASLGRGPLGPRTPAEGWRPKVRHGSFASVERSAHRFRSIPITGQHESRTGLRIQGPKATWH